MINYHYLKKIAKEKKLKVDSLLALSSRNDPFYAGSKSQVRDAEWFVNIYKSMGHPQEFHIRRVHYFVISKGILKPNGEVYQNTENDWNYLSQASKYARFLELVSYSAFIDRRNPEPIINANYCDDSTLENELSNIDLETILSSLTYQFGSIFNPNNVLPYHIEIWCEKSTMNDVLIPICQTYEANLVLGLGELSITQVYNLINRIRNANKPVRIFYISDFDPAGLNMPVSVSRKLEFLVNKLGIEQDIKLKQMMLTLKQCKDFKLPRIPIKDSDKRKAKFEENFGQGATELDALEALHPGLMTEILTNEINPYFDADAFNRVVYENQRIQSEVRAIVRDKTKGLIEHLKKSEIKCDFKPFQSDLNVDEADDWLFDSKLSYFDQLKKYRIFKNLLSSGDNYE